MLVYLAQYMCSQASVLITSDGDAALLLRLDRRALSDVTEQLRRCPVGLDTLLGRTVPQGVAYHHAGASQGVAYHHAGTSQGVANHDAGTSVYYCMYYVHV